MAQFQTNMSKLRYKRKCHFFKKYFLEKNRQNNLSNEKLRKQKNQNNRS